MVILNVPSGGTTYPISLKQTSVPFAKSSRYFLEYGVFVQFPSADCLSILYHSPVVISILRLFVNSTARESIGILIGFGSIMDIVMPSAVE